MPRVPAAPGRSVEDSIEDSTGWPLGRERQPLGPAEISRAELTGRSM